MNRRALLIGSAAALTATGALASLLVPTSLPVSRVFLRDGLAIGGIDPVAYFTKGRPIGGDPAVWTKWEGATWRFVDSDHRDRFLADPTAYAPQYGGFCAWAVAAKGELYSTKPQNWAIVDGRLFLNFDDDVQALWNQDRQGFIAQADARWPGIVAQA
ncbi:YHS domain-containing (seleno)protein [Jannaschia pohangensis]|uniref:YHS domain-containing protein n=1 Tax=Jannaschia pohangensis TaxID=390807 RepID=A0A1I3IAI0_9RHOB|nr:YHS domain-containing (seleno)protein [Jannaschia pohangensis]SFI44952.1 hypothetical protein SAMN04488095_0882 [Jannaschia pohangensis]